MIDIRSYFTALKAMWVKRLVNDCEGGWTIIPQHYFYNFGSNWLVFQTNSGDKTDESIENIPDFYKDIIKCWKLTGGGLTKKPETFTDIRKQILWNNKFIKFENKAIFQKKKWIKSDLIYVNDIFDAKRLYFSRHNFK